MADIVYEREGFGKFAVQVECGGDSARDLRDLKCVCETVAKVIRVARGEDLRFRFQTAKSPRMNDAVTVARVFGAVGMARLRIAAPTRKSFAHGQRRKWGGARRHSLRN